MLPYLVQFVDGVPLVFLLLRSLLLHLLLRDIGAQTKVESKY
jgi:hypothetical protein